MACFTGSFAINVTLALIKASTEQILIFRVMKYLLIVALIFIFSQNQELFGQSTKTDSLISYYAKEHQFNGTILVQKDGAKFYNNSFGIADRQFDVPVTNETIYKIASVTKTFTAVLILQLYEHQKIDLNQTIKTYLPNYKGEAGTKVTIHELLNHTSGMRNIDTIKSIESALKYGLGLYQKPFTSNQLLNDFCSDSLINIPGKKFDYNNGEYIILGKIIEAIYGRSYDEIVNEKILKPLGMKNSGMLYQQNIIKHLANSYFLRTDTKQLICDLPIYIENWYAAGAMYSCTDDLMKFSNALYGLRLINKASLELMINPGLDDYGYSVWISDTKGDNTRYKRVERFGSIMGSNAVWMHFLNKDLTIIILSNTNLTDLGDYGFSIAKMIIN
jgi:CubicO group peptidase (beta-lactamase class C family)